MNAVPQGSEILAVVAVVVYLVVVVLSIVIGYLILKSAVKNGTLAAMRQAQREGLIR